MIEVVSGRDLASRRVEVAHVYSDAFGHDFRHLTRNRARLRRAFAHMINLDVFWVAMVDGEPAAIAALTDGHELAIQHEASQLRRHLGPIRGRIADRVFRAEFGQVAAEPLPMGSASIEYVGTAEKYQRQGLGLALLSHLLSLPKYDTYYLEAVADTNEAALHLYRKLGFEEYQRVPVNHTWMTGINAYVSLKLRQDSPVRRSDAM